MNKLVNQTRDTFQYFIWQKDRYDGFHTTPNNISLVVERYRKYSLLTRNLEYILYLYFIRLTRPYPKNKKSRPTPQTYRCVFSQRSPGQQITVHRQNSVSGNVTKVHPQNQQTQFSFSTQPSQGQRLVGTTVSLSHLHVCKMHAHCSTVSLTQGHIPAPSRQG